MSGILNSDMGVYDNDRDGDDDDDRVNSLNFIDLIFVPFTAPRCLSHASLVIFSTKFFFLFCALCFRHAFSFCYTFFFVVHVSVRVCVYNFFFRRSYFTWSCSCSSNTFYS